MWKLLSTFHAIFSPCVCTCVYVCCAKYYFTKWVGRQRVMQKLRVLNSTLEYLNSPCIPTSLNTLVIYITSNFSLLPISLFNGLSKSSTHIHTHNIHNTPSHAVVRRSSGNPRIKAQPSSCNNPTGVYHHQKKKIGTGISCPLQRAEHWAEHQNGPLGRGSLVLVYDFPGKAFSLTMPTYHPYNHHHLWYYILLLQ